MNRMAKCALALVLLLVMTAASAMAAESVSNADEFKKAVEEGKDVILSSSFSVASQNDKTDAQYVLIAQGKSVTIDFNGHTITAVDNNPSANYQFIFNKGTLVLKDSSKDAQGGITLSATTDRDWNNLSAIVTNSGAGSKVTIESGVYKHNGGTDMAYVVDNNSNSVSVYLTVNGGTLYSKYRAIRAFQNSANHENVMVINGGTIEGENAGIWQQSTNKNNNKGSLTVNDGTIIGNSSTAIYTWQPEGSASASNISTTINGGTLEGATGLKVALPGAGETISVTGGTSVSDLSEYVDPDVVMATISVDGETLYAVGKQSVSNAVADAADKNAAETTVVVTQGNLTLSNVPAGVTVSVEDGATANVNDYTLNDSNATITIPVPATPTPAPTATPVPDTSNMPQTGDNSNLALFALLLTASAAGMMLLMRRKGAQE